MVVIRLLVVEPFAMVDSRRIPVQRVRPNNRLELPTLYQGQNINNTLIIRYEAPESLPRTPATKNKFPIAHQVADLSIAYPGLAAIGCGGERTEDLINVAPDYVKAGKHRI